MSTSTSTSTSLPKGPPPRGRLAPTPSGGLHLGNLRTALASWLSVKSRGGTWIIRMEDVDKGRSRPAVAEEQLRDLAALGLESDAPVLWQSSRDGAYLAALERLRALGTLYPCACTRRDLELMTSAPHESEGLRPYPGRCRERRLDADAPLGATPLRFRLPPGAVAWEDLLLGRQQDDPSLLTGDPLLYRRDGCFAYHLAVVLDDGEQGVDEVVRGRDLRGVTATQIRLQEALGLPRPAYAHLGLVEGPDGSRLSKRAGAADLRGLAERGVRVPELLGWLGWSLGCLDRPESCAAGELVSRFQWNAVPAGPVHIPETWVG